MKKRILSVVLSVVMLMTAFSFTALALNTANLNVTVGEITDGQVTVSVDLTQNTGIAAIYFQLNYDKTKIVPASYQLASIFGETQTNLGDPTNEGDYSGYDYVTYQYSGATNKTVTGTLLTITFDVLPGTWETTPVSLTYWGNETQNDGAIVDAAWENVSVTITGDTEVALPEIDFDVVNYNGVYDGQAHSASAVTEISGVEFSYSSNNSQANVGHYDVEVTATATGYKTTKKDADIDITAKQVTLTGVYAENKTYDTTTDAVINVEEAELVGVVAGDEDFVVAVVPESGVFAAADADEDVVVTADDVVLSGDKAANYTLKNPTLSLKADIEPAVVYVTARADSKKTHEEDPVFEYDVVGETYGAEFTGALTREKAGNKKVGTYDILLGTLSLGDNFTIEFTGNTFTVADKTVQNVSVAPVGTKTYGDDDFTLDIDYDDESELTDTTVESSNQNVAVVDEDNVITIVGAGTSNLKVTVAGDNDYADAVKTVRLTVDKREVTITMDSYAIKVGEDIPEFGFAITAGELVAGDEITGAPSSRGTNTREGTFDITKGNIKINSNYDITFVNGTLTVSEKEPQTDVEVPAIGEITYGDEPFNLNVEFGSETGFTEIDYATSDEDVAVVDEEGNVTIVGAGAVTLTVTIPGDDIYADYVEKLHFNVAKAVLEVEDVDFSSGKPVVIGATVGEDEVELDLSNAIVEIVGEGDDVYDIQITGFLFSGSDDYEPNPDQQIVTLYNVPSEYFATVSVNCGTQGTVTGEGVYLVGSKATLVADPDGGYGVAGWFDGTTKVSSSKEYTFTVTEDITLTVKFIRRSGGFYPLPGKDTSDDSITTTKPKLVIELTIDMKDAFVNGEQVWNDVAPIIENDRTMLPSRFVAELLGATVEWNEAERKVTITGNNKVIEIYIDSNIAYVNGFQKTLDAPAFIRDNRTYTPIRFIAENLGATVEWKAITRTVIITK